MNSTGILSFHGIVIYIVIIIILSNETCIIEGSMLFFGNCIPKSVVRNLDLRKYSGIWYEIDSYYSLADSGDKCTSFKYYTPQQRKDGEQFMNFMKKSITGIAEMISTKTGLVEYQNRTNESGRLEAKFTAINRNTKDSSSQYESNEAYWILGTDYDTYSVVWSCENVGIMNFQNVIFLARERDPRMSVRGRAYGVIRSHGLSTRLLMSRTQEDCPQLFPTTKIINSSP